MRSLSFTLVLALLAAAVCGVIGWQAKQGNLDSVFGIPPTQPGQRLYTGFQPAEVARISVSASGNQASFVKTADGWESIGEHPDRMDPRYALAIIAFTLNLEVRDFAPVDDMNRRKSGLREDSIQIRLENAAGTQLARYRLGNRTPLQSENKDADTPDPTVFIQIRDRARREFVYACTGDIRPLFKDGFKYLRDHRTFYFNPQLIQKIRLRGAEGELTLGHDDPKAAWKITKPLDLRTDPTAVKSLLEGLFELKALTIADRSAVTLPGAEASTKTLQIGLTSFGSQAEILLEVFPPATPDAREALATVSNRPNTVFHLPLKPEPGFVSLASLPVAVNELRDPTLTHLNIASLRAISIRAITGKRILITRNPPKPWQVEIDGKIREANEQQLFALLKTLTTARAKSFESDAATDFSPWGLNKPFLAIELTGEGDQALKLHFGMDGRGGIFVNREGTPTVMRIDETLLSAVSIQPHEWRHARLWSISTVDLVSIERTVKSSPPLLLNYQFNEESWTARSGSEDVSARLDPAKINRLLNEIVGLNVTKWLSASDPDAAAALADPLLTLAVTERTVDDFGDTNGPAKRRTLRFASAGTAGYFGRLDAEPNPFLLDRHAFLKIALDPLEK